ncbi:MAG: L-serine ammonia-lyase, iron-sulfur-dependent, subunit alpha [Bacteroidales bacterium]|uniref:L-serine ammonia-lyase, iron-sulfur-dependent, subunit alpha n=1 Tax=Porphyromonas sp. TaxID=1924944 RepID=UPI0029775709|nr:L-serine ammonia-lyase, iron-sulfur-dependent, subunit alpha [Porphyromonas sp.]MDD7437563.1 L-serine ammonia-lyase, iron-sulfur-dependent, subunit alpha [Bacteroidales bacterium]MDY3067252.1 L-serine ammonia-lyase, iron-sulfur-dependent, subunit alpha [Porphyromonas sp.]
METIKTIYKIGHGPSSSHTMAPRRAAEMFAKRFVGNRPNGFRVHLYGSLAATGKGHMTDVAIIDVLEKIAPTKILWEPTIVPEFHTNGLLFEALGEGDKILDSWEVYSIGGGSLANKDFDESRNEQIYPHSTMMEIMNYCYQERITYWEYVERFDDLTVWDHLANVWQVMRSAVERGLVAEGILPGGLNLRRKSGEYLVRAKGYSSNVSTRGLVYAYALAVSEENAAGNIVVTAPTCGSSGVMPAVLYHLQTSRDFPDRMIHRALATAALFGNIARTNASISGAEVGCQGEVGVACSMAAAAANQLFGGSLNQIEYAAEMGLEHHLGLTCDPICGLVQIPCIERNAFAAARALDSNTFSTFSNGFHRVSFDQVVEVMKQTGHDLPSLYKETSEGGLATNYCIIP